MVLLQHVMASTCTTEKVGAWVWCAFSEADSGSPKHVLKNRMHSNNEASIYTSPAHYSKYTRDGSQAKGCDFVLATHTVWLCVGG
jgi:hypothetical protein